ncbi:hypothetical protein ES703_90390 [subsurface metagenome]
MIVLASFVGAQEKTGCLAKGPLEVHVTDLGAHALRALACRLVRTLHQSRVRYEVVDFREAADIVDLVEDHQSKGLSDSGDAAQQVHGYRVVFRHLGVDLPFDSEDLLL